MCVCGEGGGHTSIRDGLKTPTTIWGYGVRTIVTGCDISERSRMAASELQYLETLELFTSVVYAKRQSCLDKLACTRVYNMCSIEPDASMRSVTPLVLAHKSFSSGESC